ncbi:MAG: glycine betaine ABC transporter substrate-binding protein [Ilumatobacteraceae bacterium]
MPVFSSELNDAYGVELTDLVDQISLALDTEELTELNRQYGLEKRDAADVAHDWLDQYGFL